MKYQTSQQVEEFLYESNKIEGVYDLPSLTQALKAWNYLIKWDKLTKQNILKTHAILMKGKLDKQEIGAWRRQAVWISGQEAKPWYAVPDLMEQWINMANHGIEIKPVDEDVFKNDHINFEAIHPCTDGNGRLGRLLMNWARIKVGLSILIIKEAKKFAYYEWFEN